MSIVIERSFLNVHSKGCTLWLRRLFLKSLFVFLSFAWLKYKPPHFPMGKMNGSVKFCKYLSTLLLGKPFALELKPSKPSSLSSNSRTSRSLKRRRRSERNRFDSVSFDRLFFSVCYSLTVPRQPARLRIFATSMVVPIPSVYSPAPMAIPIPAVAQIPAAVVSPLTV